MFKVYIFIITFLNSLSSQALSNDTFNNFVKGISKEAEKKGVSVKVIKDYKSKVSFIPRVIELDRSQPEFKLTLDQYLARVVTASRIKKANSRYKKNKKLLNVISKHYGVQPRFLVALWGIETDFGRLTGGFSVISALSTLAFEGRRHEYFKKNCLMLLKL